MTRRWRIAALCAVALALLAPAGAGAAHSLRYVIGSWEPAPKVIEYNEGPCGAAVDSQGNLYVSDYYHDRITVFTAGGIYITQIGGVNPLNGPCGLAVDEGGTLYANLYHGGVVVLTPSSFPPTKATAYANSGTLLSTNATGIALDPASGNLLLDERTAVAEYELPLTTGEAPLRTIGAGSLADGYGIAVSGFAATEGRIYVADAAEETVKVYDPETSLTTPVETISGEGTPAGGFNDLADSALAVDDATGRLLVADNIDGPLFEAPRAAIEEFDAAGGFLEQLKPTAVHGEPVGLAVDNTGSTGQGNVYVTSGNTEKASVLAFGPWTPGGEGESLAHAPEGGSPATSSAASVPAPNPAPSSSAGAAGASASVVSQKNGLRVAVAGKISPKKLPRHGSAPVSVSVSGHVGSADGGAPPQLRRLVIEINRHGRLDLRGLPLCPLSRIQPASSARALAGCRSALVGEGRFSAETSLSGGEPYPTEGRLLLFNAREGGHPVLFGHIYATKPFTSSHVIPFRIGVSPRGTWGTELSADLARSLGERSRLTGIEMTLSRRWRHHGRSHSFLSAGCPAPKGFSGASFPLTRTSFEFAGDKRISSTLTDSCRVRG